MNLFIPEIGTKLILTEDSNVVLYKDTKNNNLAHALSLDPEKNTDIIIPAGTIMTIRGFYLKQAYSHKSSVVFSIAKNCSPNKKFHGQSFRLMLSDVNNIEYKLSDCDEILLKDLKWCMESIKKIAPYLDLYRYVESLLFDTKNINTFREMGEGREFYETAIKKLETCCYSLNHDRDFFEKCLKIFTPKLRKYKIAALL